MGRVDWDTGWYERIDKEIDNFMEKLAEDVLQDMIAHAPFRTGALKADLGKEYDNRSKIARVGAESIPYAIYVEEGTPPHVIRAKKGGGLHWLGAEHPMSEVNHPGATATHFMKNALYKERRP